MKSQALAIQDLKRRVGGVERWQTDWPQHGQLNEDVRQNKDLEHNKEWTVEIRRRLGKLEDESVDRIRERLDTLEARK